MTPGTVESAFNAEPANRLHSRHPRWRECRHIAAEQRRALAGHPGNRPDPVIRHPGALPVIVETGFQPARKGGQDAIAHPGKTVDGQIIEGGLADRGNRASDRHEDEGSLPAIDIHGTRCSGTSSDSETFMQREECVLWCPGNGPACCTIGQHPGEQMTQSNANRRVEGNGGRGRTYRSRNRTRTHRPPPTGLSGSGVPMMVGIGVFCPVDAAGYPSRLRR